MKPNPQRTHKKGKHVKIGPQYVKKRVWVSTIGSLIFYFSKSKKKETTIFETYHILEKKMEIFLK